MREDAALVLADRLLDALIARPEALGGFLFQTGADPAALRAPRLDPDLARAVLDHVMAEEGLLRDLCHDLDLPLDTPARAQVALGGGPGPHWT